MVNNSYFRGPSNFVCAGADTFISLHGKFIDNYGNGKYHDDNSLAIFLSNSVNKFLYSYGSCLNYKTKKISKNYTEKIVGEIDKMITRPFMKDMLLIADSGGFQVANGAVKTQDMSLFITMYHDFLKSNHQKLSAAFHLDLPPGPGSKDIFKSYQQIEDINRLSYQTTCGLDQIIKDKMIYIHHFRTPDLFKTWSKFLFDENLADGFSRFGTGGIVAQGSTDMIIPVIIYSIPLSSIVKHVMSKNMTKFSFHVLGGANFQDIVYHKLFAHHIKKVHNVDCQITYDSSAIFKGLAIGRFIPTFNNDDNFMKMDLRSAALKLRFDQTHTIEDKVYELLNDIATNYNFGVLDRVNDPIYCPESGTFHRPTHMYLMLYMFRIYRYVELFIEQEIERIYPLYESGNVTDFDRECFLLSQRINQGRITRKQKAKTYSIYKSLNILTNLDEDYNKHLVNKYMASDNLSLVDDGSLKF